MDLSYHFLNPGVILAPIIPSGRKTYSLTRCCVSKCLPFFGLNLPLATAIWCPSVLLLSRVRNHSCFLYLDARGFWDAFPGILLSAIYSTYWRVLSVCLHFLCGMCSKFFSSCCYLLLLLFFFFSISPISIFRWTNLNCIQLVHHWIVLWHKDVLILFFNPL